jgi:signal transduction histidine kinase/phage shock protein PspC (stress-responsive transcriptional regulator)
MSGVAAGAAQGEGSARPLRRSRDDRVIAGVCAGIARWLGVDSIVVRAAFVVAAAAGGIGFVVYAIAALLIPEDAASGPARPPAPSAGRWYVVTGVALLALSLLLFARELGLWFTDALVWPVVLAAAGAALLWHRSAAAAAVEPAELREGPHWRPLPIGRIATGVALVLGAGLLFLVANDALSAARDVALTAFAVAIALALILAPLWWRLVRNLTAERRERIRTQERAELAAHLHDSVLQTLALVQHRAEDPRAVASLARRQERELRAWLAGRPARERGTSLGGALEAAADEVEQSHGVTIDVVTVGDGELDETAEAVVAAAREALVNAAKFAGEQPIAVYAEVTDDRMQVFVRDRGPGFDLEAVPSTRRGIRESIVGRLERHGGTATVRTGAGAGTEVELVVDRRPR